MLSKREITINRILCGILFAACLFCFAGDDATIITKWGYTLLECIRTGQFRQYANVLESLGNRTNYTLVVNFLTALWLSPLYLISHLIGRTCDMILCYTWFKCLIGLATVLTYRKLCQILAQSGAGRTDAPDAPVTVSHSAGLIWFTLPFVVLGIVAVGQVDMIGVLCLLLAYEQIRRGKYYRAAVWLAAALCIKALAVMIFVPWILLLWKKDRVRECLAMLGIPALTYLIQYKLADLLFENYNYHAAQFNSQIRFADRLFAVSAGQISLFLLAVIVICYLCFYLAVRNRVVEWHFAYMPLLVMTAFVLCVRWNPQYLIYMVPAIIAIAERMRSRLDVYACTFLMGLGYVISVPITDPARYDSNGMMDYSLLRLVRGSDYAGYYIEDYLNALSEHTASIGRTLLAAGLVLLVVLAAAEGKKSAPEEYPVLEKLLWYANYLPAVLFVAASLILYF